MVTDKNTVKKILPARSADANKYSVGSLLCVCGSYGMAGAAILSARSALRMGAGLVRCAVPERIYPIVSSAVPEAVFLVLPEGRDGAVSADAVADIIRIANKSDAVLMGCGSKFCEDTRRVAMSLVQECTAPLVLDADGINSVAKHIHILKDREYPTVLTPHEGEMARLTGLSSAEIRADREAAAVKFADEYGVTLVLKGKDTLIAQKDREIAINPTGNPGMAVAGSGDVLAGMIASLMAQGAEPMEASVAGVYLHGLAGDIARDDLTEFSLLPSDITDRIPKAVKECIL